LGSSKWASIWTVALSSPAPVVRCEPPPAGLVMSQVSFVETGET
jgi:hypothetical protein